jgi:hypothetical protein
MVISFLSLKTLDTVVVLIGAVGVLPGADYASDGKSRSPPRPIAPALFGELQGLQIAADSIVIV